MSIISNVHLQRCQGYKMLKWLTFQQNILLKLDNDMENKENGMLFYTRNKNQLKIN
jgi:hypothetical protein